MISQKRHLYVAYIVQMNTLYLQYRNPTATMNFILFM